MKDLSFISPKTGIGFTRFKNCLGQIIDIYTQTVVNQYLPKIFYSNEKLILESQTFYFPISIFP